MKTLTNCRECGKEVSKSAAACPACGVAHPAGKKSGCLAYGVLGVLLVVLLKVCADGGASKPTAVKAPEPLAVAAAPTVSQAPLTPKEAREKAIDDARGEMPEMINGCCFMCGQYLKRTANDPDSIECVQSSIPIIEGPSWTTTTIFRGKNGFGAKVLGKKKFFLQSNQVVDVK